MARHTRHPTLHLDLETPSSSSTPPWVERFEADQLLLRGRQQLTDAGTLWERLVTAAGAPPTLDVPVLDAWLDRSGQEPVTLLLSRDGDPVAGVVLAVESDAFGLRFTKVGVPGEPYAVPAVDAAAARSMARMLPRALDAVGPRWRLAVDDLPDPDPVVDELRRMGARAGRWASLRPGVEVPCLHVGADSRPEASVSRNTRSVVARARRRIAAAGLGLELRWTADRAGLERTVDEVVTLHAARNRQLRGRAGLDDEAERRLFVRCLRGYADRGRLRLLEVRIDGALAAFACCVVAGPVCWVYANYAHPDWLAFSPGTIGNTEVVAAAHRDPEVRVLDWGGGVQRYKLSGGAYLRRTGSLQMASSAAVAAARALRSRVSRPWS